MKVGSYPSGVAFTLNGSKVYVTNDDGTVSVIDTATNKVITNVKLGNKSAGIAINSAGTKAYVTKAYVTNQASDDVSIIDINTNREVAIPEELQLFRMDLKYMW